MSENSFRYFSTFISTAIVLILLPVSSSAQAKTSTITYHNNTGATIEIWCRSQDGHSAFKDSKIVIPPETKKTVSARSGVVTCTHNASRTTGDPYFEKDAVLYPNRHYNMELFARHFGKKTMFDKPSFDNSKAQKKIKHLTKEATAGNRHNVFWQFKYNSKGKQCKCHKYSTSKREEGWQYIDWFDTKDRAELAVTNLNKREKSCGLGC